MIDMKNAIAKLEGALSIEPKTKADQAHRAELMYEANAIAQVLQAQSLYKIATALTPEAPKVQPQAGTGTLTRSMRMAMLQAERALDESIERGDLENGSALTADEAQGVDRHA